MVDLGKLSQHIGKQIKTDNPAIIKQAKEVVNCREAIRLANSFHADALRKLWDMVTSVYPETEGYEMSYDHVTDTITLKWCKEILGILRDENTKTD